jgi:hypothetical protein
VSYNVTIPEPANAPIPEEKEVEAADAAEEGGDSSSISPQLSATTAVSEATMQMSAKPARSARIEANKNKRATLTIDSVRNRISSSMLQISVAPSKRS